MDKLDSHDGIFTFGDEAAGLTEFAERGACARPDSPQFFLSGGE